MDYLPVYQNEVTANANDVVKIDSHKIQMLGVQTQVVTRQSLGHEIRALGTLEIDESSLVDISPRFAGWVNNLMVNSTGEQVNKGEILFTVTIPTLYYAEFAYKQAVKKSVEVAAAAPDVQRQAELQLVSAMERLEEIGVPQEEMERLQRGGEPFAQISHRSPSSGVVLQKNIVQGARIEAGDRLYQLADLSKLWLSVQLPETELAGLKVGDSLEVQLLAERGKYRKTKVDFIYPSLDNDNRNFKFRALIDNPNHTLKPGQSAEVWVQAQARKALAIPVNALLDSGREQWVLVAASPGIYQPRKVQVGERNLDWIEIISGVEDGEQVVTNANFLIDSESRLQSALTNFEQSSAAHQEKSPTTTPSGMEH